MFASVRGYDVFHTSAGEGVPVIAIHGFGIDHRIMLNSHEPVFRQRDGYKRIYFDLPGMGRSSKAMPRDSDEMLQIVMDFIDQVAPGRRFLLTGASYGSYLARGVVKRWPKRVLGMMLPVPMIVARREERELPQRVVLKEDAELLKTLTKEEREEFSSTATVLDRSVWKMYRKSIMPGVQATDQARLAEFQAKGYAFSFDVDRLDKPFPAPALFIMGRQDHVVGYADALRIIENYPRATVAVLDRASHALEMEQYGLFNTLMSEWLDRVEEWMGDEWPGKRFRAGNV